MLSFVRVAVAMVSLQRTEILTKTTTPNLLEEEDFKDKIFSLNLSEGPKISEATREGHTDEALGVTAYPIKAAVLLWLYIDSADGRFGGMD